MTVILEFLICLIVLIVGWLGRKSKEIDDYNKGMKEIERRNNLPVWDRVREGVHTVTVNGQTHNFLNDWDINESENYWNSQLSFDDYLVKHYIDWGRGFGNLCQNIIDKDGKSISTFSSDFEASKLFESYSVEKLKELKDLKIKYAVGSTSIGNGGVRKGYIENLYPDYSNNSTFKKAKEIQSHIDVYYESRNDSLIWNKARENSGFIKVKGKTHKLTDTEINQTESYWESGLSLDDFALKRYIDWGDSGAKGWGSIIDKDGNAINDYSLTIKGRELFENSSIKKIEEIKDLKVKYTIESEFLKRPVRLYMGNITLNNSESSCIRKVQKKIEESYKKPINIEIEK